MRGDISALGVDKLYFGLRDYGTATWEGGDAACDHLNSMAGPTRRDTNSSLREGRAGPGLVPYRDTCGKCGARRVDNQIGLEETPDAYVAKLVEVFREVRRLLREDGCLWLNLGDSYNGSAPNRTGTNGYNDGRINRDKRFSVGGTEGLKPKDLIGIPWMVAFALRADGWWLRSDIIWSKPNPMPESVTDRPTKAHEYIFLLSKSASYFYDSDAIREPTVSTDDFERRGNGGSYAFKPTAPVTHMGANPAGRNRRSVWTMTTKPYAGAHFATFPPDLIEPCILAGTSAHGACAKCGSPWARVVEREFVGQSNPFGPAQKTQGNRTTLSGKQMAERDAARKVIDRGWQPTCTCGCTDVVPCTVLDPFAGSGTTLAVALKHNRRGIGIELNESYISLAHDRIRKSQPMLLSAW